MQKKAQLAVFFLIGVIIVITFVITSILTSNSEPQLESALPVGSSAEPINSFVEDCLKSRLESAILFIGMQGGFYEPASFEEYLTLQIPFYLRDEDMKSPTTTDIEEELSKYVLDNMDYCINEFKSFEDIGYEIEAEQMNATTRIGEEDVVVSLQYPLSIVEGESRSEIADFSAKVDFAFGSVLQIVSDFVETQNTDIESVHFGHLARLAYENDFFFEIIQTDSNTIIYAFKFNSVLIKNQPFTYNFAARYNW